MKLNNKGFSLIELILVLGIFIVVMLMMSSSFETILGKSGQQMKSATTDTEGMVGLEVLRSDLERSGFGLPFSFAVTPSNPFDETTVSPVTDITSSSFNEITPRAIQAALVPAGKKIIDGSGNSNAGAAYLVIKATNVAQNDTGKKWSYVTYQSSGTSNTSYVAPWSSGAAADNFTTGERVITLNSTFDSAGNPDKRLAMDGSTSPVKFFYALSGVPSLVPSAQVQPYSDAFKPSDATQLSIVYGVDPGTDLRMPYNRADYYVKKPATVPASCNPGTGVLFKAITQHADGSMLEYPLLTCVGDLQVEFELDRNNDGNIAYSPTLTATDGVTPLSAADIRAQLKNIRVYILSHEGKKDGNYSYSGASVQVGDPARPASSGRTLDAAAMTSLFGGDWQNYRWKVRTIVVHPKNLD